MKKLLFILLLIPISCISQKSSEIPDGLKRLLDDVEYCEICNIHGKTNVIAIHTKYRKLYDSSLQHTICRHNCGHYPHYFTEDPDGIPIYGPQQALIGIKTKQGFVKTYHRDHLQGHPQDSTLLTNEAKLTIYLKQVL